MLESLNKWQLMLRAVEKVDALSDTCSDRAHALARIIIPFA